MIEDSTIKAVADGANLLELIEEDGFEPRNSGPNHIICCPFHSEKTPSFTIYEANRFKCFGCGETGDGIAWMTKHRGLQFVDAVKALASRQGIHIDDTTPINDPSKRLGKASAATKARPVKVTRDASDKKLDPEGEVFRYLVDVRKLDPDTLSRYGVAQGEVFEDGQRFAACVFPLKDADGTLRNIKRIGVELNANGKKRIRTAPGGDKILFGKHAVGDAATDGDSEILIAEGEIDALSWASLGMAAVSIPFGAGNHDWLENDFDWVSDFGRVLIAFDADETGQAGADELVRRIGREKCFKIDMPDGAKDANEALQRGMGGKLAECYRDARPIMPDELRPASDFIGEVEEMMRGEVEQGTAVFFTSDFKLRPHELTLWTGYSGHGKSAVLSQVIGERLDAGERACIASLEIRPKKTTLIIAKQRSGIGNPGPEELRKDWLQNLWYFAHVGNRDWHDIIEVFEYAYRRFNVTQFVIDSLLRCGIASEDYGQQKVFVDALANLVDRYPIHVHLVAHARKAADESNPPDKLDVKGSGDITDAVHNGITVWRNKAKERGMKDPGKSIDEQANLRSQPDARLLMWKQREGGEEPFALLDFDPESILFSTN